MATQGTLIYFVKFGGLGKVKVETTTTIDVILDKIYDVQKPFFERHLLAPFDLELFAPSDLTRNPISSLPQRVDGWQLGDPLDIDASIAETFSNGLDPKLVHLVVVPRPTATSIVNPPKATPFDSPVAQNKLHDYLTFSVRRLSSGKPDWPSVIQPNGYCTYTAEVLPQFVKDVVYRPRRTATGESDLQNVFKLTLAKFMPSNDRTQIVQKLLSSANEALPYTDTNLEICHFIYAACAYFALPRSHIEVTKEILYILVFIKFRLYWNKEVEGGECKFEKQFQFPLIAIVEDLTETDEAKCKYRPQPDVTFYKHNFPCFMAEIDSKDNAKDKHRLYVQLACSLRLGLALRGETSGKDKDLFLMGAYFTNQDIHRFFVCADEAGKPTFHEQLYKINNDSDFTTFLFEFYNYARHVRDEFKLGSESEDIKNLAQSISVGYTKSLHTKSHNLPDAGEDDANHDSNGHGSKKDYKKQRRAEMTAALRESGFVVKNYQYDVELEPLIKLPDHVVEATSSNRVRVIAKLLHKDSDELSLLRELATQKSPHNHVIPLLSTVQSSLGPLIILPYEEPLSTLFLFGGNSDHERLGRELVEGVAFLHRLKIAHLDIKPDNLVFNRKAKRLHIIDFDIAMRCKDIETMVKISSGTPGWSAPEIVHDDSKPLRAVSPIRADLWSCGKVLEFLAVQTEIDRAVMKLTNLLLHHDPRRRPLLHEVVDENPDFWASGRLLQALESHGYRDKVQETMLGRDLCKPKRARDGSSHASDDGLPSKVSRKAGDSTTRSSFSLDSLPSSSPRPSLSFSADPSLNTASIPSISVITGKADDPPPDDHGKAGMMKEWDSG